MVLITKKNWVSTSVLLNNYYTKTETDVLLESKIWETFETVSKNLKGNQADFFYTWDKLTSIVYSVWVFTTIKTLNYTWDKLTSIVLSEDVPWWINLTKTFNYTWDTLTWYSYS